jgi:hypothetical protein
VRFAPVLKPAAVSEAWPKTAWPGERLSAMLEQPVWDDAFVSGAGVRIVDAYLASIGGGLGSFALVEFLRIAGLAPSSIAVLSNSSAPHETFAALLRASQLTLDDRLRSDSSSTINNIWGWPGYALLEAIAEHTLAPLWRVVTEPLLSEYFTPRVRTVLAGIEREAARIGWSDMLVRSWAEVVRRRYNGGYFVLVRPLADEAGGAVAYRCQHVHLALGHAGPRFLPDLLAFRKRYGGVRRMVNGYEPHEDVYEHLIRSPGRVVLRGSGITASRILERLIHDRDESGARTKILHVFRNYVRGPSGPPWFRRPGGHGFAYQPFSFPKAAGGGQLRQRMLTLSGEARANFIASMSGTTTSRRVGWQRQLARGRREGWYRVRTGVITDICLKPSGSLSIAFADGEPGESPADADFVIDASGLENDIRRHGLLADLLHHSGASINSLGGLDVEPSFEVCGARSGAGRMYASGVAALGGALAPVDSFWGLMHAAMEICDDLANQGVFEFPSTLHSISQWWRWVRNQRP